MSDRVANIIAPIGRNRDLVLVAALIGILIVILKPLPTVVLDILLSINLTFSILILLTTVYVKQALDFAVFPSLLLVATLYRLALNIASTRLILANAGDSETAAAGEVIQLFGNFVTPQGALTPFRTTANVTGGCRGVGVRPCTGELRKRRQGLHVAVLIG